VIGFQVSAASLGAAGVPAFAGVLAKRLGLEVIGPVLLGVAIALLVLHEVIVQLTRASGRHGVPVAPDVPPAAVSQTLP
jgi:Asp/Glu/hydantoin racemase